MLAAGSRFDGADTLSARSATQCAKHERVVVAIGCRARGLLKWRIASFAPSDLYIALDDPAIRTTNLGHSIFECVLLDGHGFSLLRAMCGRLRVGKKNLHFAALVGAAMRSACLRGSHRRCHNALHGSGRPDRKALGSAILATRAVASAGPTPGIASSRLLVALDRCQAMMRRSNSRI